MGDSSKENKNKSSADYYRKSDRSDRESRDKDRDRDRERRRRREERNDSSSPIQGKIYERKQDGSISSRDKKDERKILYERKDDSAPLSIKSRLGQRAPELDDTKIRKSTSSRRF